MNVRKEIETIRNQLGPDWLQTLTATREAANPIEAELESANESTRSRTNTPEVPCISTNVSTDDQSKPQEHNQDINENIGEGIKPEKSTTQLISIENTDNDNSNIDNDNSNSDNDNSHMSKPNRANSKLETRFESSNDPSFVSGISSSSSALVITLDSSGNNVNLSDSGVVRSDSGVVRSDSGVVRSDSNVVRSDSNVMRSDSGMMRSGPVVSRPDSVFSWSRTDTTDVDYGETRKIYN